MVPDSRLLSAELVGLLPVARKAVWALPFVLVLHFPASRIWWSLTLLRVRSEAGEMEGDRASPTALQSRQLASTLVGSSEWFSVLSSEMFLEYTGFLLETFLDLRIL